MMKHKEVYSPNSFVVIIVCFVFLLKLEYCGKEKGFIKTKIKDSQVFHVAGNMEDDGEVMGYGLRVWVRGMASIGWGCLYVCMYVC